MLSHRLDMNGPVHVRIGGDVSHAVLAALVRSFGILAPGAAKTMPPDCAH